MTPPRVLVVGPSWVGDMVMAQSLFIALRQRDPATRIDVLAPPWSRPLLERMPEVSAAVDLPVAHGELALRERWRVARGLRGAYDQAILLPNSLKSALVPFLARIPLRTGWLGERRYGLLNDIRRLDEGRLPMTVQRFVALADPADAAQPPRVAPPRLAVKVADVLAALRALGVAKHASRRVLALCPGAEFGPAKRWPADRFGALAARRLAAGWDVWLFGSAKDGPVCEGVNAAVEGRCVDLAGRTSLAQAVDLLSIADAVVSNDSGLMHVAAALGRPLVAVYGSSDPGFTPPLSAKAKVVRLGLACSPCFRRECPYGHTDCLQGIAVERVDAALDAVIM
jgi:heptosyltransferase-2